MSLPKGMALCYHENKIIAVLYQTNIAIIDAIKGTVKLNNGGWNTVHTKKCMNRILEKHGLYVYQKNFTWYVTQTINNVSKTYEYFNEIELDLNKGGLV